MAKKNLIKKIGKICLYTVLIILSLPLILFLALKSPKVQTFVVHEVTSILSNKLNAEISIESVDYAFFNKLKINKVFVRDQHGDTLLYTKRIYASMRGFSFKNRAISIGTAELDNGKFYLKQDSTGVLNLKFIIDAFASKDTTKKKKQEYRFKVRNFKLTDFAFIYKKWGAASKSEGMNYSDLDIRHINLDLRDIKINGSKITAKMENLSAYEKCGFLLEHLGADVDFSPKEIVLSNAKVITPLTKLTASYIKFRFNGFHDWKDYVHKVKMDVDIKNSLVDFRTIAYFAPTLSKWTFRGYVDGRVRGPVSALKSDNFEYRSTDSTYLALNFSIVGLPKAWETVWRGNIEKLTSNGPELGQLIKTFVGTHGEQVAGIISKLGKIDLNAYFSGKFTAFTSSALVNSSIGSVTASLDTRETNSHTSGYALNASTKSLNLGRLLDLKDFGTLTTTFTSEGNTSGRIINSSTSNAEIEEMQFKGYSYHKVAARIDRTGKEYNLLMNVDCKDAILTLAGSYNFEQPLSHTIASAKINHINLHNLNFIKQDTITSIKGLFTADFKGSNINEMNGKFTIENANIESRRKKVMVGRSVVEIRNDDKLHEVRVNSDLMDATLRSNTSLLNIGKAINHFVAQYTPNLLASSAGVTTSAKPLSKKADAKDKQTKVDSTNRVIQYLLEAKIKNGGDAISLFIPTLKVEKGTTILANLSPTTNKVDIKFRSSDVQFAQNHFKNITLQSTGNAESLRADVSCGKFQNGGIAIQNIDFTTFTQQNKVNSTVVFNNSTKESKNEGLVKFITNFEKTSTSRKPLIKVNIIKSNITINDTPWIIGSAKVLIDSSSVDIEDFKVTNQQQKIAIAGKISENKDEQLHFIINNLDIQNFRTLFEKSGYEVQGSVNGIATLKSIYKSPMLFSNIRLDNTYINGRSVGSPELISSWDDVSKKVTILSTNTINDKEVYRVSGTFAPETKDINLDVNIAQLRTFLLEPYTKGIVSDLRGYISAKLSVTGKSTAPIIEGEAFLNHVSAKVDFLNTVYSIDAPIKISRNELKIENDTLFDIYGKRALVNASVTHDYLKNFKFDINIEPENLLALNTTARQNAIFYGNAFATGRVRIFGDPQDLQMNISAQTEKNTKVFIPINSRTQVRDQSFITFINPNSDEVNFTPSQKKGKVKPKARFKIFLDLNVTPEAEAQILLDPSTGSVLKAQGNSNLTMEVDPSTNLFQIKGTYTIQKGSVRFNLLNVTSKDFTIDNGSTITWTGDPTNASINVNGTYKVRTTLAPLFVNSGFEGSNQRQNIDCKILLSGMLLNPTIKFDLKLPEADAATQTAVAATLNNESLMQKQFISLLWLGQFYPEQENDGNNTAFANAGKGMASDLIFSQLNNLVSQISNSFDLGIKYTPATSTTEQEYEVHFSKNLFNDWVTVNGVVDFSGNTKSTGQGVAGDYDVEVRLDKKDRLKFKMFSYQQQDNLLKLNNTKQGVGILYQEQFGSFKDLFRRKKSTKEQPKRDTTATLPNRKVQLQKPAPKKR